MDPRERTLLTITSYDILGALGWRLPPLGKRWVELLVRAPARRFARGCVLFDDAIPADGGLRAAARAFLPTFADRFVVRGAPSIPARGPVLLLSNHPGLCDTLALFAAVPRADLKILAADRPFLRTLSSAARHLIFIPEGPGPAAAAGRAAAVRAAVEHLRGGGALLTFPAGVIEPDPAVLPGARESLATWSRSTAVFLRRAPGLTVVPVIVSGVLSRRAQRSPLTLLRRTRKDREWLGAMLQIVARMILPRAWPVAVRVDVLAPLPAAGLPMDPDAALDAIRVRVAEGLQGRAHVLARSGPAQ